MSDSLVRTNEPGTLEHEAQAWVIRLDSQQATVEDAAAFKRWCEQSAAHAAAFAQARRVWQAMRPAALRFERSADAANRLPARMIEMKSRRAPSMGRRAFLGSALAASAAYLAIRPPLQLWPSMLELGADYRTGTGEQREVTFGDGLVVQMNTQTRINVRSRSAIELLAGEAEIQTNVRPPVRWSVAVGEGAITASDARFNIRHTGQDVCVTCLEGRVEIELGEQRIALVRDQQLTYNELALGTPRGADVATVTAWRQRQLVFDQIPLSTVVEEINRYRPGKILLTSAELGESRVQASFSIDHLDDVIALIRDVYGAEVTHLPGGIVLLSQAA